MSSPNSLARYLVLLRWGLACACAIVLSPAGTANAESAGPSALTQKDIAKQYEQAAALFERGEVSQSLELFTELVQVSDSPNVTLYLGYCQQRLGRLREAYRSFARSAKRAAETEDVRYRPTMMAAQDQLTVLGLQLAKLTISLAETPPGVLVRVDGEVVATSELGSPIIVEEGDHQIDASAQGFHSLKRQVLLNKGDSKTITLLFEKQGPEGSARSLLAVTPSPNDATASTSWSHLTTLGIIAGGVGVVGLGAFTVFGLKARSVNERLDSECSSGCADETHRNLVDDGKTHQLLANTGLAVGLVGIVSSATLFYLGVTQKTTPRPAVGFAPGVAHLALEGKF